MSKGLSSVKTLSAKEIAKKWNLSLSVVAKKIAAGVKVEKEHTKSTSQANEIARDHLGERPDYYDKLGKMEKQPVVKENTGVTGVAGLGFNTGVPAIDDDNDYITTNALARDPMNGAIMDFINKHHQHLHSKTSFKQYDAKKIKTNSNKDLAESLGSDYGTTAVPVIGDLTGTPRKVTKVDEVKLPPKARKAVATGMTLANLYTAGDVASRAQQGIGSPAKDIVTAASTLPGTKGWSAYGADKARQAYEYIKGKRMKEEKNQVPANTVERGIYEATFQGKTVPLGKPMKGDVKKSKVFVDPDGDGKAQKVNFGDPNMTIKKSNPARRKSFRARHNCDNPGPKTKARYWSCRAWEETQIDEARKSSRNPAGAMAIRRSANAKYEPDEIGKKYPNYRGGFDAERVRALKAKLADDVARGRKDVKEESLEETTLRKKIKYAIKAAGQQSRIAKELRPDEVENDKTYQKRKKGMNRVFKESHIREFDTSSLPMSQNIVDRRKGSTSGGATPQNLETPTTAMGIKDRPSAASTATPSNTGGSGRSFPLDKQGKLNKVELRRQSEKDYESKTPSQMNEISAELVGKVSNARWKQGKAPSKTLSHAINKKFIETTAKKEDDTPFEGSRKRSHEKSSTHVRRLAVNAMKKYTTEETTMDTKELINEALDNILEENLVAMKENFQIALQEKMMEKLEERKKIIASDYFAQ